MSIKLKTSFFYTIIVEATRKVKIVAVMSIIIVMIYKSRTASLNFRVEVKIAVMEIGMWV